MKCNIEWLSAYLDGALAEDRRAELEKHLKTCEACAAKLEEFVRVEQAAKKIPAPQLSEAYWENFASRVQNKLTIREKQKTSPGWLEALKSFFQPTTGKLAIAGSVAVILLLTFVSLKQWRTQTFRPPVFETEKPALQGKVDSVPYPTKNESAFRAAEKDNKVGLAEEKRLNQPAGERGMVTPSQKPAEVAPAASAPVARALAAPEGQKSKEEPSLAASAERDETVKVDTVVVASGKKVKEMEKTLIQSQSNLQKRSLTGAPVKGQTQRGDVDDTTFSSLGVEANVPSAPKDVTTKAAAPKESIQELGLIRGGFDAQYGNKVMPPIDTAQVIADIRQIIAEKEKQLKGKLSKTEAESLYIYLAQYYVQLYRFSLDQKDWEKADKRLADFLKADLSEPSRQWLVAIQAELKKLKK